MIRRPVPVIKPRNEKHAALSARLKLLLSYISSPMSAPANGPNSMPTGLAVRMPTKTPMVAPQEPVFDPPAFFVKNEGTKKLISSAATHTAALMMSVRTVRFDAGQK